MQFDVRVSNKEGSDKLSKLLPKVNKQNPQQKDLQALRTLMEEDSGIWRTTGDMGHLVETQIFANHFNESAFGKEVIKRKLRQIRDDFGWQTAEPIEKLLIREIGLCYLNRHITEIRKQQSTAGQHSFRQGLYWEKALDRAQTRYTRALETFAKVQRLMAQTSEIEQRASALRSANTLKSANLLKALTT